MSKRWKKMDGINKQAKLQSITPIHTMVIGNPSFWFLLYPTDCDCDCDFVIVVMVVIIVGYLYEGDLKPWNTNFHWRCHASFHFWETDFHWESQDLHHLCTSAMIELLCLKTRKYCPFFNLLPWKEFFWKENFLLRTKANNECKSRRSGAWCVCVCVCLAVYYI